MTRPPGGVPVLAAPTPDTERPVPRRGREDGPMVVGDTTWEGPGAPDRPTTDVGHRTSGSGLRGWVLAALVVTTAGLALAVVRATGPVAVEVPDPVTGAMTPAPSVPAGPVVQRWELPILGSRELVDVAVVTDRVVVVTRPAGPDSTPRGLEVTAHAQVDGRRLWVRRFADPRVAVLVGDDAEAALVVIDRDSDEPTVRRSAEGASSVVSLDIDGTDRWRVELRGATTSAVLDVEHRHLRVSDADGAAGVDLDTGRMGPRLQSLEGPGGIRRAHRSADTWVVPTTDGWEVRPDDGSPTTTHRGQAIAPVVTPRLVVVADGSRISAQSRRTGTTAYELDLGRRVGDLRPVVAEGTDFEHQPSRFPLSTTPTDPDGVVATVAATPGRPALDQVLTGDGEVVTTRASLAPPRAGDHLTMRVAVDGHALSLCHRSSWSWPPGNCPHDVALADQDGQVLGAIDDLVGIGLASATWSRVTQRGVLVQDGDDVELRTWPHLDVAWSIPDGAADSVASDLRISTSPRGVAVGTRSYTDLVAWYA